MPPLRNTWITARALPGRWIPASDSRANICVNANEPNPNPLRCRKRRREQLFKSVSVMDSFVILIDKMEFIGREQCMGKLNPCRIRVLRFLNILQRRCDVLVAGRA